MAADSLDAATLRDWLLTQAAEVRHSLKWRSNALSAYMKSGPEYTERYRELLAQDDESWRQRIESLRDVGDACPVDVRAKLYSAVTALSGGDWADVPILLSEAAAMLGGAAGAAEEPTIPREFRSQPMTAKEVAEAAGVMHHSNPAKWLASSGITHERSGRKFVVDTRCLPSKPST